MKHCISLDLKDNYCSQKLVPDEGKKSINVSNQWRTTTKSQSALVVMNCDAVNTVKYHHITLWFTDCTIFESYDNKDNI